jgi:hypothetical protein
MFKIGSSESYSWPVTITLPDNEGKFSKQDLTAVFKRLSQTETEILMTDAAAGKLKDREIAAQILMDWKNIVDDSGNQVPFTPALRDQVLNISTVAGQIVRAWIESLAVGKTKN